METICIAKKRLTANAVAFLKIQNGKLTVSGKFYDEGRGYPGPEVVLDDITISEELLDEVMFREGWTHPMSEELKAFTENAFAAAATQNPWFS